MKKIISLLIVLAVILSSVGVFADEVKTTTPVTAAPKITFTDVDANTVSGQAIYKLVNAGILNGYTDGTFKPNNPITRAELCKVINLAFGYTEPAETGFVDVKSTDWFCNYVLVAKKAGYINGYEDNTFRGNNYLTREQACAVITRVGNLYDITMTEQITDPISSWAVPYVNKVVANRFMTLEAGGKFRATQNITRAELVEVIAKFVVVNDKPADGVSTFSVTFNSNGGSAVNTAVVDKDKTVVKPINPTKAGYTFDGWYTDSGLTKAFDFNTKITANITLYAKWNKASTAAGGAGGTGGGSTGGGSTGGGSTGGGSTGGGSTGGGNDTPSTPDPTPTPDPDPTPTPSKTYTVTFNSAGTTFKSVTVESGNVVDHPGDPDRSGYVFKGWYADSAFKNEYDFSSSITKNTTIYAKWNPLYTVTFNSNGGTTFDSVTVESGYSVDYPGEPERDGYRFVGWYSDSALKNEYDFSSSITKNTTIYAKWVAVCRVIFETNGGSYIDDVLVDYKTAVEEPYVEEWPGYVFMGWYTDPDFIAKYDFSRILYEDRILYAKWIEWDEGKQSEVFDAISSLKDEVEPLVWEFEGNAYEILEIVYAVLGYVLDDATNGIPIYDGDYILDNYGKEISDANDLYDAMSKDEQSNFYSVLLTELGEEKADSLLVTIFGINISDAKDKIDK